MAVRHGRETAATRDVRTRTFVQAFVSHPTPTRTKITGKSPPSFHCFSGRDQSAHLPHTHATHPRAVCLLLTWRTALGLGRRWSWSRSSTSAGSPPAPGMATGRSPSPSPSPRWACRRPPPPPLSAERERPGCSFRRPPCPSGLPSRRPGPRPPPRRRRPLLPLRSGTGPLPSSTVPGGARLVFGARTSSRSCRRRCFAGHLRPWESCCCSCRLGRPYATDTHMKRGEEETPSFDHRPSARNIGTEATTAVPADDRFPSRPSPSLAGGATTQSEQPGEFKRERPTQTTPHAPPPPAPPTRTRFYLCISALPLRRRQHLPADGEDLSLSLSGLRDGETDLDDAPPPAPAGLELLSTWWTRDRKDFRTARPWSGAAREGAGWGEEIGAHVVRSDEIRGCRDAHLENPG